jgi:transposase
MLALKLVLEGRENQAVADTLGRCQATVQQWINKFRKGGVEGLLKKSKGNGPESKLTAEMEAAMSEDLRKGKWRTARDAWNWLSANFETGGLKQSVIYKYLGKCGGRLKATRPCNPKKDEAAEAEFRVKLADELHELGLPAGVPVKLRVYDEFQRSAG